MNNRKAKLFATWILGGVLLVFYLAVFTFGPASLPDYKQRMLGIASAVLAGLFAFFLTGQIGIIWQASNSWFGRMTVRATGGVAVFVLVLWWWFGPHAPIRVMDALERVRVLEQYAAGGAYPEIDVELYFGPTSTPRRSLSTTPVNPGFLAIFVENTNDYPVFDVLLSMIDSTQHGKDPRTMQRFNDGQKSWPILHPNVARTFLLPVNTNLTNLALDFFCKTRAADTAHRLRFVVVSKRWEFARKVTKGSEVLAQTASTNFPRNGEGEPEW